MNIIQINSFQQFLEQIEKYNMGHPIFRGCSRSDYELITKFGRSIIENERYRKLNSEYTYVVDYASELSIIQKFKDLAPAHLNTLPNNEWEWLSLAQHYGLPTRLLDWTENPLVALYFCLNRNHADFDGAVYVIRECFEISKAEIGKSPYSIEEVVLYEPRHTTPRISAQSGLFTAHKNPQVAYERDEIDKLIISNKIKGDFWARLRTFGVNPFSMFPDLSGLCEKIIVDYGLD